MSPVQKEEFHLTLEKDVEMHAMADIIISGWPDDIKEVPHPLCPYLQHHESLTVEDRLVFHGEALVIPLSEREKILGTLHQSHQGITKTQLLAYGCVFWPNMNKATEEAFWQCETCMRFQAQNTHQHLHLHAPGRYVHQILTLDGVDYLILTPNQFLLQVNSGMQPPCRPKQLCQSHSHPGGIVFDHGTPDVLHMNNGPQYASAVFADWSIEWGFTHETSSSHYPQSNGFAKLHVKIIKHTLHCFKDSSTNPRIALWHLKATPVDAKHLSPSQVLYNCKMCTTIPSRIQNTDPAALQVQEHLEDQAEQTKSNADKCS